MVSLCTSMPTNRVGCSMIRLLCLRLHARPSGATLDHRHTAMTAHPFRLDTDMRSSAGEAVTYLLSTWQDWDHPGDLLSNIGLYMPLGCLVALALRDKTYGVVRILAGTACGILLSFAIETVQVYDLERVPSFGDVYANGIGSILGAVFGTMIG